MSHELWDHCTTYVRVEAVISFRNRTTPCTQLKIPLNSVSTVIGSLHRFDLFCRPRRDGNCWSMDAGRPDGIVEVRYRKLHHILYGCNMHGRQYNIFYSCTWVIRFKIVIRFIYPGFTLNDVRVIVAIVVEQNPCEVDERGRLSEESDWIFRFTFLLYLNIGSQFRRL